MKKIIIAIALLVIAASGVAADDLLELKSECGNDPFHPGYGVMAACTKGPEPITAEWTTCDGTADGTIVLPVCHGNDKSWTYFLVPEDRTIFLKYQDTEISKVQDEKTCEQDFVPDPDPCVPEFTAIGAGIAAAGAGLVVLLRRKTPSKGE